jgi:Xaa-Pro aminopeptidase
MRDVIHRTNECKPAIDVAKLARALRSSSASFRALVREYRRQGITERDIVAAMAASPHLVDPIGRGQ